MSLFVASSPIIIFQEKADLLALLGNAGAQAAIASQHRADFAKYQFAVCSVVIPSLEERIDQGLPLIAQPLGCDLAPMPLRRQRGAQDFQQRRQRLHESVGRVDDIEACAVIDAGLIAIVQPMLHPQQFRDAELS